MTILGDYATSRHGQIHLRCLAAADGSDRTLICLHPAPSSGLWFATAMPLLNGSRTVLAPDYPGYGGSAGLSSPPNIGDYADAMLDVIADLESTTPVDLLGFHTGCFVGAEMALRQPEVVGQLLLCDVPSFAADQRVALKQKMAVPMNVTPELKSLTSVWDFNIAPRVPDVPMERALELLAEHLRAGEHDYYAFAAAFDYEWETRFAELRADTTVLATQSALHASSVAGAAVIEGATFVDVPEVTSAVFETGAAAISKRILSALGET